ncbi:MAG: histidine kinase [Acidimicrobiales bacterium]
MSTIVAVVVLIEAASFAIGFAFEYHLRSVGREDLGSLGEGLLGLAMVATTTVVGAALMRRRPGHPVGWLFVALGTSITTSAFLDPYALQGVVVSPGSLPGASLVAVVDSLSFVPWLVLIALILHLTPSGRPLSRRFAFAMRVTIVAGLVTVIGGLLSNRVLDAPFDELDNPLAVGPLAGMFRVVCAVAISVVGLGVLASALSLVLRFRRAQGIERLQLAWFAIIAFPVAVLMAASFVPGHTRFHFSPLIPTAGIVVLIAVATGLAVQRYRLYDVERILSRTLTYGLLSGLVIAVFLVVTVVGGAVFGRRSDASRVSVAFATLSAVGVAEPGRRRLQDLLDQRFDRRRYSALAVLRRHLDAPGPVTDIQAVLREALGDDSLEISYPLDNGDSATSVWATASGRAATSRETSIDVLRGDRLVARVAYAQDVVEADVADELFRAAATELDNAGLRAALAVQLVEVQQSRARLAAGQHEERHRIERNLHDGAQQRLLALALQLQAASVNGTEQRLRDAVDAGVCEVRQAVVELRALANGLRPTVLSDGGLHGALEDLADRSPVTVTIESPLGHLAPDLEETAWFIVSEAVANSQKHGSADTIEVTARLRDGLLTVAISDDGCGGADGEGRGLRGLRDRAEAVGGSLVVRSSAATGTTIEALLPCG